MRIQLLDRKFYAVYKRTTSLLKGARCLYAFVVDEIHDESDLDLQTKVPRVQMPRDGDTHSGYLWPMIRQSSMETGSRPDPNLDSSKTPH